MWVYVCWYSTLLTWYANPEGLSDLLWRVRRHVDVGSGRALALTFLTNQPSTFEKRETQSCRNPFRLVAQHPLLQFNSTRFNYMPWHHIIPKEQLLDEFIFGHQLRQIKSRCLVSLVARDKFKIQLNQLILQRIVMKRESLSNRTWNGTRPHEMSNARWNCSYLYRSNKNSWLR